MRLLYDNYDEITRRSTSVEIDSETGLWVIVRTQDTKPIVESAKALAASFDPHTVRKRPFVHVARIPAVIAARLRRTGVLGDEAALNAWLQRPENRVFRTDDGRKI
jgi:hypothetical protein